MHLVYTLAVKKVYDVLDYKNAYTYLIIIFGYLLILIVFVLGAFMDKIKSRFGSVDFFIGSSFSSSPDDESKVSLAYR